MHRLRFDEAVVEADVPATAPCWSEKPRASPRQDQILLRRQRLSDVDIRYNRGNV